MLNFENSVSDRGLLAGSGREIKERTSRNT